MFNLSTPTPTHCTIRKNEHAHSFTHHMSYQKLCLSSFCACLLSHFSPNIRRTNLLSILLFLRFIFFMLLHSFMTSYKTLFTHSLPDYYPQTSLSYVRLLSNLSPFTILTHSRFLNASITSSKTQLFSNLRNIYIRRFAHSLHPVFTDLFNNLANTHSFTTSNATLTRSFIYFPHRDVLTTSTNCLMHSRTRIYPSSHSVLIYSFTSTHSHI